MPADRRTCTICDDGDGRHHASGTRLTSVWPQLDDAAWLEVGTLYQDFLRRLHAIVERSCYRDIERKHRAMLAARQAKGAVGDDAR